LAAGAGAAFSYDPATFTATWTLATAGLGPDKLLLDLDGDSAAGVTDAAGNRLDGEWTGAADVFPTGDGFANGDFRFNMNVLPGDVNRSGGTVNAGDVTQVRNRQFTDTETPGAAPNLYTVFHDVNGNGVINAQDVTLVRNRQFTELPAGEPTASALATSGDAAADASAGANLLPSEPRKRLVDDLIV
jgi:hypothetical protein